MNKLLYLLLTIYFIFFSAISSPAFWVNVHEEIADRTIEREKNAINLSINSQTGLENALGLVAQSAMLNKSLKMWITYGCRKEDDTPRYLNHFYNPLTGSGLNDWFAGKPSIEWADDAGNELSWRGARNMYHLGLTATTDAERRAALADSFRALGQVMHLVQDLAVPAHVRNDAHPSGDGFEAYTSKNVDALNFSPIEFKGPKATVSPYAPRQLWNSNQYDGTNPSTSAAIGLAEYTNANFASEDTIFTENNLADWSPLNNKHYFPYPRREDTVVFAEGQNTNWNGFEVYRKYFEKVGGGQAIKHFATASRLYAYLNDDPDPSLQGFDDRCYKDYADLLIPRAVGYSAALINYFFRGQLKMEPDSGNPSQYVIKNESDEDMSGTFWLYYDDTSGNRKPVGGAEWPLDIPAKGTSTPVTFTAPSDATEAGKYVLAYWGQLGAEEEAVVGGVFNSVPKPPPYVFISSQRLGYQDVNSESIGFGTFVGVLWNYEKDEEVPVYEADGVTRIKPPYFLGSPGWDYPHNRYPSGGARRLPEGIAYKLGLEKWEWTRGVRYSDSETCSFPEWTSCKDSENPYYGSYALPWSCGPMPYGTSKEMDGTCYDRHLSSNMVTYGWLPNSPDIVYKGIFHYDKDVYWEGLLPIVSYGSSSYTGVNLSQDFPIVSNLLQYSPYGYLNLVVGRGRSFLNEHVSFFSGNRSEIYEGWSKNVLAVQFARTLIDQKAGEAGYDYSNNAWKILNMTAIKSAVSDAEYSWDTENGAYIDLLFPTEDTPGNSGNGGSNPQEEALDPPETTSDPPDDLVPIIPIIDPPLEVDGSPPLPPGSF